MQGRFLETRYLGFCQSFARKIGNNLDAQQKGINQRQLLSLFHEIQFGQKLWHGIMVFQVSPAGPRVLLRTPQGQAGVSALNYRCPN